MFVDVVVSFSKEVTEFSDRCRTAVDMVSRFFNVDIRVTISFAPQLCTASPLNRVTHQCYVSEGTTRHSTSFLRKHHVVEDGAPQFLGKLSPIAFPEAVNAIGDSLSPITFTASGMLLASLCARCTQWSLLCPLYGRRKAPSPTTKFLVVAITL